VTPRFIVRPKAEADMAEAYEWYETRSGESGRNEANEDGTPVAEERNVSLSGTVPKSQAAQIW
jgi:hypothetical protein